MPIPQNQVVMNGVYRLRKMEGFLVTGRVEFYPIVVQAVVNKLDAGMVEGDLRLDQISHSGFTRVGTFIMPLERFAVGVESIV